MLTFEFEPRDESFCECCGNKLVRLTRFVHENSDAHAVYYAQFAEGHEDKVVVGIVSLGIWCGDAGPEDRLAFPFRIWTDDDNFNVGLMNAADSPWKDAELLGRILDREEALKHEWVKEVFHITDHMVVDDPEIVEYFKS